MFTRLTGAKVGHTMRMGVSLWRCLYFQKLTEYLKDHCGLYEMDIALQDVEGPPGKKPNLPVDVCVSPQ